MFRLPTVKTIPLITGQSEGKVLRLIDKAQQCPGKSFSIIAPGVKKKKEIEEEEET